MNSFYYSQDQYMFMYMFSMAVWQIGRTRTKMKNLEKEISVKIETHGSQKYLSGQREKGRLKLLIMQ